MILYQEIGKGSGYPVQRSLVGVDEKSESMRFMSDMARLIAYDWTGEMSGTLHKLSAQA